MTTDPVRDTAERIIDLARMTHSGECVFAAFCHEVQQQLQALAADILAKEQAAS